MKGNRDTFSRNDQRRFDQLVKARLAKHDRASTKRFRDHLAAVETAHEAERARQQLVISELLRCNRILTEQDRRSKDECDRLRRRYSEAERLFEKGGRLMAIFSGGKR